MSYLANDIEIHEIVNSTTDFAFLLSDIQQVLDYESLYPQEQNLLMYSLKIFGEMSKSPKMVESVMTNGLIALTLRILEEDSKFSKEVRIWALIIINRGTMHSGLAHEFLDRTLKTDPPLFLEFILFISAIEDVEFTIHSRLVWQEIERQSKAGS